MNRAQFLPRVAEENVSTADALARANAGQVPDDMVALLEEVPEATMEYLETALDLVYVGFPSRRRRCEAIVGHADRQWLLDSLNRLMADGQLAFEDVWVVGELVATPYGIFPKGYGGESRLPQLLLGTCPRDRLDCGLRAVDLVDGPLALRVFDLCLLLDPRGVLDRLYTLPELQDFGKELGLVHTAEAGDKARLLEAIVWKLGFARPTAMF